MRDWHITWQQWHVTELHLVVMNHNIISLTSSSPCVCGLQGYWMTRTFSRWCKAPTWRRCAPRGGRRAVAWGCWRTGSRCLSSPPRAPGRPRPSRRVSNPGSERGCGGRIKERMGWLKGEAEGGKINWSPSGGLKEWGKRGCGKAEGRGRERIRSNE